MKINPIVLEPVPPYSGLDGRNADSYYRAGQRSALLYSEVISPFEDSLKEEVGYSDYNIPEEETDVTVHAGGFEFLVKATPTRKRPGYKEVVEDIEGFLGNRLEQYMEGERPPGILTIDDCPYVQLAAVLDRIREYRESLISEGVKIGISERPAMPSGKGSIVIPLGMDVSELTDGNASRYLEAMKMKEGYTNLIGAFEKDLLGLTGFSEENLPEQTEHMYAKLGEHIFHVRSVPYRSTSWGKVLSGLDKGPTKRKPENGGDLSLIELGMQLPRLDAYVPRQRDGEPFIRLEAVLSRIGELTDENSCTKLRQKPISHYPIV